MYCCRFMIRPYLDLHTSYTLPWCCCTSKEEPSSVTFTSCRTFNSMAIHLQAEKNWTEHVVVDGKLVTGQNPQVSLQV